ncbi:amino acid adenylation domain-containing protein [Amycolatopsis sp. NPDC059021]|uniref:non-ribosomal peptide synthetase n=1 Tax=Amycolatopsis sp. NPDC059021 TaxID=3346704 RepID=UPI0036731DEF
MSLDIEPLRGAIDDDAGRPTSLYEYFERAASRWPDAVAVDIPPSADRADRCLLTYAEARSKAGAAARILRRAVPHSCVVAVLLPRTSEHLYLTQLAVLKAGSAYFCVDPAFPDDQLAHVLADSEAAILVTDAAGAERAERIGYRGAVLRVDRKLDTTGWPVAAPPAPEDLAYIIYTSGTTGRPKGVMIPHRGIVNLVEADLAEFGLGPGDRVAQGSSAAYDSSVEEIWLALASGGTVVVVDDSTARLGPDLVPWLRRERITVLAPTPTLLRATGCQDPETELPELRLVYVGGEALPEDVAEKWARGRRMMNGYGPTECTVTCLWQEIRPGAPIAVGRPVPGMRAWVLDEQLDPVARGEKGELCMSGPGLALGYYRNADLTARKFPDHPALGRVYRTGDLVHAEADGTLFYHGRIDSQAKLRGYRVELEAIETCLSRCPGVAGAACRVQGEGAGQVIAAHVVLTDPDAALDVEGLKARVGKELPAYMVPTLFARIDRLPRGTSDKLRRDLLPVIATAARPAAERVAPSDPVEALIAQAVAEVFSLPGVSADADFFTGLGGSSLQAALVISLLRKDSRTETLTVRDLYETRTIAGLARRAAPPPVSDPMTTRFPVPAKPGRPIGVTVVQTLLLLAELAALAPAGFLVVFRLVPWLAGTFDLATLVLAVPLLFFPLRLLATPLAVLFAVRVKRILIGRYRPLRAPAWGGFALRQWIVRHAVRAIPWRAIAGTEFQCMALRALGARIGRRVHLHRGVDLARGGWDLLDIGDDVTLSQDAAVRLVQFDDGNLVVGPVSIGHGAVLDVRAGVGPHTRVGTNAWLAPLSSLPSGGAIPDGQYWDGVPAKPVAATPPPPTPIIRGSYLSPVVHGLAMIACRTLLDWLFALPATASAIALILAFDVTTYDRLLVVLTTPQAFLPLLGTAAVLACLTLVGTLMLEALAARLLGRIRAGTISRWSPGYLRVWLKTGLVSSAGNWLSGGLYWPVWLRWAGMKVGRGCEISTIIDVVPELVEIGKDTFFADGIYLGGARVQRGTVALGRVRISPDTFVGNHAVIRGGQTLPPGILIGVCTVADERVIRPGSSWFGHPPFELPRREIVASDRKTTYEPSAIRYVDRLFWEWLRFTLPVVPMAIGVAWFWAVGAAARVLPAWLFYVAGVVVITTAAALLPMLLVLCLKWTLLGKVRPGTHALWSCWCSRWDFLYVAWSRIGAGTISQLEGTLLLPLFLRRTGMKIGKRVVLGDGFAQIVDPDMLDIGEGATVNAMFQAHTFEDRVLKIDRIVVGAHSTLAAATVPLYGAEIGTRTTVAAHSVVMKHEVLLPGLRYEGVPTRKQDDFTPLRYGRHALGIPAHRRPGRGW